MIAYQLHFTMQYGATPDTSQGAYNKETQGWGKVKEQEKQSLEGRYPIYEFMRYVHFRCS